MAKPTRLQAFWARVDVTPECWNWTAATNTRYPVFSFGGRGNQGYAHRWAYEHFVGPIPEGYEIDHLCRNPLCVRPDHLEAVTPEENMRRTRKLVCANGHLILGENLQSNGRYRKCRPCAKERWANYTRPERHRCKRFRPECEKCVAGVPYKAA